MQKQEVEALLGFRITDEQLREARGHALRKQEHIYQMERPPSVLHHGYLATLTEEYARSLALSKFTMDLCRTLQNMEKEHSANCQSALTDSHIVAVSAL